MLPVKFFKVLCYGLDFPVYQRRFLSVSRTHMAPAYTTFPFPKDLFLKFIDEYDGESLYLLHQNITSHELVSKWFTEQHALKCIMPAGYFPIKLEALPEGTCVHAHVPVYQV
jgi:nicotinamide phosphoribosyltransferase